MRLKAPPRAVIVVPLLRRPLVAEVLPLELSSVKVPPRRAIAVVVPVLGPSTPLVVSPVPDRAKVEPELMPMVPVSPVTLPLKVCVVPLPPRRLNPPLVVMAPEKAALPQRQFVDRAAGESGGARCTGCNGTASAQLANAEVSGRASPRLRGGGQRRSGSKVHRVRAECLAGGVVARRRGTKGQRTAVEVDGADEIASPGGCIQGERPGAGSCSAAEAEAVVARKD